MYEERRNKFSLRDSILVILLMILFIFIIIWLFPTKSFLEHNTSKEQYINYLNEMENAAKDYFTTDRMPAKIGDSVRLTLSEMLEEKMVLEIGGNAVCSLEDSYVEVTKMDNNYKLRTSLTCEKFDDYKITTIGCRDYCDGSCTPTEEKQEEPTPVPQSTKYTVTFDSNGGSAVSKQVVESGKKATKPTNPTRAGYTFIDWTLNGITYNFNAPVTRNITLVARWKKNETPVTKYTVTFDSNGGSAVSSQTVVSGAKATKPVNPIKSGYTFIEWTLNGKAYNFDTPVTSNITLVANWKKNDVVTTEYEYRKYNSSSYSYYDWSDWSNAITEDGVTTSSFVDTANRQYEIIDSGSRKGTATDCTTKNVSGTLTVDTQPAKTITVSGYENADPITKTTTTYTDWVSAGTTRSTTTLSNTDTKRYILIDIESSSESCIGCTNTTTYVYKVETRTATKSSTVTCPATYTLTNTTGGSTCTKKVTVNELSCSAYGSAYKLLNGQCVKQETVTNQEEVCSNTVTNVPYVTYRYRTMQQYYGSSGSYSYKYSASKNDTTLTSQGYKLTGKVCTTTNGTRVCK